MTRKSVKSARALPRNVDSGKLTRKNTKQPNCYTGQPRRWVYCGARTLADDILEIAEVYASNTEAIPFKIRKSMAESMRLLSRYMLHARGKKRPRKLNELGEVISQIITRHTDLTASELRYCELEGIDPADFRQAKYGAR
jgi:hypothetical protein